MVTEQGFPLVGPIIRHLLDEKLVSHDEIRTITGRGTSTVYRWMSGASQPSLDDVSLMLRNFQNKDARRTFLGMLTCDLPVTIKWLTDWKHLQITTDKDWTRVGHETLSASVLALTCLSHILEHAHEALRKQELTEISFIKITDIINDAIEHLTVTKSLLGTIVTKRKKPNHSR